MHHFQNQLYGLSGQLIMAYGGSTTALHALHRSCSSSQLLTQRVSGTVNLCTALHSLHSSAQLCTASAQLSGLHSSAQLCAAPRSSAQPAQHSTAQPGIAQHSTAQHSSAQHSSAQHSSATHRFAQLLRVCIA
jgi:hypothetical protein